MITGTEMVFQGKPLREVGEFCVSIKHEHALDLVNLSILWILLGSRTPLDLIW